MWAPPGRPLMAPDYTEAMTDHPSSEQQEKFSLGQTGMPASPLATNRKLCPGSNWLALQLTLRTLSGGIINGPILPSVLDSGKEEQA